MPRPSDFSGVSGRILTLPRAMAAAAAVLLVSATISLAADKPTVRVPAAHMAAQRQVMVVPDVRNQLFVFASGNLEDGGFGWKVRGSVGGFPGNVVASQSPKPGTHVIDTGAPTVTLVLARGRGVELGEPQNRSPYGASVIRAARHSKSG
jgi:PASTA domain